MKFLCFVLALLPPSIAFAGGATVDQITMSTQALPICTSGRACIYAKTSDGRPYVKDANALELDLNASRAFRVSASCSGLSSPANGWVCYDSGLSAFRFYSAGWSTGPVNDALLVHIAGTETITGAKTFSSNVTIPGTPVNSTHAASKGYVDSLPAAVFVAGGVGAFTAATYYLTAPGVAASAATNPEIFLMLATRVGIAQKLYCRLGTAPGGADTVVFTIRKNAANSTVTCTISAAGTTCNDTTHSASLTAGDRLSIEAISSAGVAADAVCSFEQVTA